MKNTIKEIIIGAMWAVGGILSALINYEKSADTPRKRNDMESAPAQTEDRRKSR